MQGKRTRALDSRGRPVAGLYVRDGRFIAGFGCPQTGKWRMQTLEAETLTDARRERESIAGLREQRVAAPAAVTFEAVFVEYQRSRNLAERTVAHERHLVDRHLGKLNAPRPRADRDRCRAAPARHAQDLFPVDVRRGPPDPDGLVRARRSAAGSRPARRWKAWSAERPKQRNAKRVAVLDAETMQKLVGAGKSTRWRAALALAGYAGLRLGEIRALTWGDIDLTAGVVNVRRSMLPEGTPKAPKTHAGADRAVAPGPPTATRRVEA